MRAVVRDAYYVVIIISNLIDIKLLEIYRINSKVILQTENQKKRSVEIIHLGKYLIKKKIVILTKQKKTSCYMIS